MKTARPCLLPLCAAATLLVAGPARADDDKPSCSYVEVARVPVHYTGTGLEVTIEGAINGTPALMLADTGAYNSALTRTGTEKRGLRLRMTGRSAAGVGGESRLYKTRVDQFVAGPANSSKGWLNVIGDTAHPASYDAIIGAPFLLQTDLEISLADKQLRFFRPRNCDAQSFLAYWDQDAIAVPFDYHRDSSPNPHFTVVVNGEKMDAMIDSGAAVSVLDSRAARRAGLKLDAPGVTRLGDVTGIGERHVALWSTNVDKFSIGAETVKGAQIGVMETDGQLNVDILLGADFLRAHRVLFAMSQKKLYLSYVGGDVFKQRRGIEPWMEHEADTGNADAQYVLARAHASGRGVPKDPGKAQAWMDKAAALGHPQANLQVGHAMMARERWTEAASHFRTVLDKLPSEHGAALWLYLARLHTGEAELGKRELEAAFAQGERDEWPTPIADFYLGQIDAAALLDAAGKQGKQSTSRTCSATGFMADWYKAKGDSAQADAMRASWRAHCAAPAPQPAAT